MRIKVQLAAYPDTLAPLMKMLVDHPELLQTEAMQTALTALPTSVAGANENARAICFLLGQHGTHEQLMTALDGHATLQDQACCIGLWLYMSQINERINARKKRSRPSIFDRFNSDDQTLSSANVLLEMLGGKEVDLTEGQLQECMSFPLQYIIRCNSKLIAAVERSTSLVGITP